MLEPFAARLNEARLAAGRPSYAMFQKVDVNLRPSTISDVLRGLTSPTLDFVVAFIKACRKFAERSGAPVDDPLLDIAAWRDDWSQLQRQLSPYRRRKKYLGDGQPGVSINAKYPVNGWPPPTQQLPSEVSVFIGRSAELNILDGLLDLRARAGAGPIVVIDGMPGVGKTALAVHWAHRVRQRFDDVLFVDLHGFGPTEPVSAEQALAALLWRLDGSPVQGPDLIQLATRYRNIIADRRLLVILDNVASIDQVRALLPTSGSSMVLVTSRQDISGAIQESIRQITLQPMALAESTELLVRLLAVNRHRHTYDPERVAELCGRLPLALRIVAERAAHRHHAGVETLADELRNERSHIDTIDATDTHGRQPTACLRIAFHWSYVALSEADRTAFRLIGLHPTTEFSLHTAAALLNQPIYETRRRLEALTSAHLLDQIAADRYRLHDLVANYAKRQSEEHDDAHTRAAAVRRLLTWYLRAATAAARLLPARELNTLDDGPARPEELLDFVDEDQSLRWCDVECANLVAAVRLASSIGEHRTAWKLPHVLLAYFERRKPWRTWIEVYRIAAESARRANDLRGLAHSLNSLGTAYRAVRSFNLAMRCFEEARSAYQTLGEVDAQAHVLDRLGATARDLGSPRVALTWYQRCLQVAHGTKDEATLARILHNLARTELELGLHLQAYTHAEDSLALFRRLGDTVGEGRSLTTLGQVYTAIELHSHAIDNFHLAVTTLQDAGDQRGVTHALDCLGQLRQLTDEVDDAG